jgi:glucose dehydrogenase
MSEIAHTLIATGRERWTYDPQVDGRWGRYACCDAVNRGLVVWPGRVCVAAEVAAVEAYVIDEAWKARASGH